MVPLQFQWDLVAVSFQPSGLCRRAKYREESAVFLHEIGAFQWLAELVTFLWKEGGTIRAEWSCGELDDASTKMGNSMITAEELW